MSLRTIIARVVPAAEGLPNEIVYLPGSRPGFCPLKRRGRPGLERDYEPVSARLLMARTRVVLGRVP